MKKKEIIGWIAAFLFAWTVIASMFAYEIYTGALDVQLSGIKNLLIANSFCALVASILLVYVTNFTN